MQQACQQLSSFLQGWHSFLPSGHLLHLQMMMQVWGLGWLLLLHPSLIYAVWLLQELKPGRFLLLHLLQAAAVVQVGPSLQEEVAEVLVGTPHQRGVGVGLEEVGALVEQVGQVEQGVVQGEQQEQQVG